MRRFLLTRWLVVIFASLYVPAAFAQSGGLDATALARLAGSWDENARELHVASYTVEIVSHDRVILRHAYGFRDCALRKKPDIGTIYYIASATKPFTAAAIMKLVEAKKVDLDAPVRRYLPRFELADPKASETITVRDLLSHRLGLDSNVIEIGEAFTGNMNDDKFYRLLKEVQPRGKFHYSNLHYTLLGRIIQAVTGERWSDYLTKNLLRPAGMKRTVTTETAIENDRNSACALEEQGDSWRPALIQKTDGTMHAAGGIGSTADDLGRWMQVQLNHGVAGKKRLLSTESMKEMFSPQAEVGAKFFTFERESYGLGWYVGSYRGEKLIHHFGSFDGARSHLSFMPDHDLAVVVLMNEEEPVFYFPDAVASDVYDLALHQQAGEQWAKVAESVATQRDKLAVRWKGFHPLSSSEFSKVDKLGLEYHNADWGTLTFERHGNAVVAHLGDLPIPLYMDPKTNEIGAEIIEIHFTANINAETVVFQHGKSLRLEFVGSKEGH